MEDDMIFFCDYGSFFSHRDIFISLLWTCHSGKIIDVKKKAIYCNRTKPLLLLSETPRFLLLWWVKVSAGKKTHYVESKCT